MALPLGNGGEQTLAVGIAAQQTLTHSIMPHPRKHVDVRRQLGKQKLCSSRLVWRCMVLGLCRSKPGVSVLCLTAQAMTTWAHLVSNQQLRPQHGLVPRFCLDAYTETGAVLAFRLSQPQIRMIVGIVGLPDKICYRVTGRAHSGEEALCLLLRRYGSTSPLVDLAMEFGIDQSCMSRLICFTAKRIWEKLKRLVTDVSVWDEYLDDLAEAVYNKTRRYRNCWGFIDGTVRPICRPVRGQMLVYSGHKRVHGLKFQAVAIACGLITHIWGPELARRHDAFMLARSGLLHQLRAMAERTGRTYCLFGDPAYPLTPYIQCGLKGAVLTAQQQQQFNAEMSASRVAVEWAFGHLLQTFPFFSFKKKHQLWLSPVALHYNVAVILLNLITRCKRGNMISRCFGVCPPSPQEYASL